MEHSKIIIKQAMQSAMCYSDYSALVKNLAIVGKTTGPNQGEAYVEYTRLNAQRMKRWEKTFAPSALATKLIGAYKNEETWLVVSEPWCGDAAHNLPVISKLAELSSTINLKIVLRDENLPLIDLFLTNGGRAIPKLIRLNNTFEVLGTWGPRPQILQNRVVQYKKNPDKSAEAYQHELQSWYNTHLGTLTEYEILNMLV